MTSERLDEATIERVSLEIAEAVMGNPTVEQVFAPEDRDSFMSDIQIEATRILSALVPSPAVSGSGGMVEALLSEDVLADNEARARSMEARGNFAYLIDTAVAFELIRIYRAMLSASPKPGASE